MSTHTWSGIMEATARAGAINIWILSAISTLTEESEIHV